MRQRPRYPVEVRRLAEESLLRVTWDDGHLSDFPFAQLRGWCPCAVCQGHGGERHYVDAPASTLDRIEVVGNYALQLAWSDGHDTGIYAYSYLRELCPCPRCAASFTT